MDLWIRSQDKEKLLKCNDIAIKNHRYDTVDEYGNRCVNFNGYEIVGYFDKNTEYEILGTYKTKERALEVLDEIQEILKPKTIIKFNEKEVYDEKENMVIGTLLPYETFDIKQLSTYVYEMPIE